MTKTGWTSNQIKHIVDSVDSFLDSYDFVKVQLVMHVLNWRWKMENGLLDVPNIEQLKSKASHLLLCSYIENTRVASGGFAAEYYKGENGEADIFNLQFVLTEKEFDFDMTKADLACETNE